MVHIIGSEASVSRATLNPLQTNPSSTLAIPRPVTEASVGTTSRLATGEINDVRPNTSSETGAVPRVAATDTARSARTESGTRCRSRSSGPDQREHAGEGRERQLEPHVEHRERVHGQHHRALQRPAPATGRAVLPTQRPARTTTIITADRTIGGEEPTNGTMSSAAPAAKTNPALRDSRANPAMAIMMAARLATWSPLTESIWAVPDRRKATIHPSSMPAVSPITTPCSTSFTRASGPRLRWALADSRSRSNQPLTPPLRPR